MVTVFSFNNILFDSSRLINDMKTFRSALSATFFLAERPMITFNFYLFNIYFCLCWVLIALDGLYLVMENGGHSLVCNSL